jgi:hypothetical protein
VTFPNRHLQTNCAPGAPPDAQPIGVLHIDSQSASLVGVSPDDHSYVEAACVPSDASPSFIAHVVLDGIPINIQRV